MEFHLGFPQDITHNRVTELLFTGLTMTFLNCFLGLVLEKLQNQPGYIESIMPTCFIHIFFYFFLRNSSTAMRANWPDQLQPKGAVRTPKSGVWVP
jgi:hypothetical protein